MPRQRSPDRDKALEIFLQHNGNIENRRIAEQLGIDEKVIAVWKSRDGWLKKKNVVQQSNGVQQTDECYTTLPAKNIPSIKKAEKGAPRSAESKTNLNTKTPHGNVGNQNAKGNPGGSGAPKGSKNALGNRGGGAPLRNENAVTLWGVCYTP